MGKDFNQTFLKSFGEFTDAPKGYMIEKNMIKWIQEILIPYVIDIRTEINQDNHPVVLILDILNQHLNENVMNEFIKIESIYSFTSSYLTSHTAM